MRNPHKLSGWELLILLLATAVMVLSFGDRDAQPAVTVYVEQQVQP